MKHKSKVIYALIVVLLISITIAVTLVLNKKYVNDKQYISLVGNDVENIDNIDKTFTSSFMDSDYLLSLLENDASKIIDEKIVKLSQLVKKSSLVMVNIGKIDIKNNISFNGETLNYDVDILQRKKEILFNNIYRIIEKLLGYNKNLTIELIYLTWDENIKDDFINNIIEDINLKYKALNDKYA